MLAALVASFFGLFAVAMTLDEPITAITDLITSVVPDLAVWIAGGLVVGLAAFAVRRLVKAAR